MAVADVSLKSGEAKELTFTVTDQNGDAVNLTGTVLSFQAKETPTDLVPIISKVNADFERAQQAQGIVSVVLDATDTDYVGVLLGELRIEFDADSIDKSRTLRMQFEQAVTT